ncbi:MAG: hypothetical protein DDG60_13365 [Anaerolineae bacterium]|nr:MAG: hypothetical protein DDG60_13365 [Anaerolineae bacterium]
MSESQESSQAEKLSNEAINRLWQHGIHEDEIFNNRLNFFLVLESVLFAVVAMLLSASAGGNTPQKQIIILRLIAILGLALTVVWTYVQARQKYVLDRLQTRMKKYIPEYAETFQEREKMRWPFSNRTLLTYVIPSLFIIIWIVLQFVI